MAKLFPAIDTAGHVAYAVEETITTPGVVLDHGLWAGLASIVTFALVNLHIC
jgi:hypothetical protein